jgi:hypothetical protein
VLYSMTIKLTDPYICQTAHRTFVKFRNLLSKAIWLITKL